MTDFNLITSINTLLVTQQKEVAIEENDEPQYNTLTDEEASRLADIIRSELTEDGLQDDKNAVIEKACLYIEDIPGLEMMKDHAEALRIILAKYYGK